MDNLAILRANLQRIEDRIAAACERGARSRADVTPVAVTKSIGPEVATLLPELGVTNLGESRPQVLWAKAAALPPTVHWHMIGHLQRNKVERTLPLVELVHSVDTLPLLEAIDAEAVKTGRNASVLLEVNVSREANKSGFAPADLGKMAERIRELKGVRVRGLMTMAAIADETEDCRPTFAELRKLREKLQAELGSTHELVHLSMGMSDDFEIAIEEGATLVRIGSALFEGIR